MSRSKSRVRFQDWSRFGLLGLVIGSVFSLAAAAVSVQDRSQALASTLAPNAVHLAAPTPVPAASTAPVAPQPAAAIQIPPTAATEIIPSPTATPDDSLFQKSLQDARDQAAAGNVKGARQTLLSRIDADGGSPDVAQIYVALGDLEITQGHSLLASGYYEQAYTLEQTPQVLLKLANAENGGGKMEQARIRYQELLSWPGQEADPFRDAARAGLSGVDSGAQITPISPGATLLPPTPLPSA